MAVVYGGERDNGLLDDLWMLQLQPGRASETGGSMGVADGKQGPTARWLPLRLRGGPSPRFGHAMIGECSCVFDERRCLPHHEDTRKGASVKGPLWLCACRHVDHSPLTTSQPIFTPFACVVNVAAAATLGGTDGGDSSSSSSSSDGSSIAEEGQPDSMDGSQASQPASMLFMFGGCLDQSSFPYLARSYTQSAELWAADISSMA